MDTSGRTVPPHGSGPGTDISVTNRESAHQVHEASKAELDLRKRAMSKMRNPYSTRSRGALMQMIRAILAQDAEGERPTLSDRQFAVRQKRRKAQGRARRVTRLAHA